MKESVSDCPIDGAMRLISGRWPALLIYYLKDGTRRFSELRRDNPGLSHRMLTLELRKLEEAGVVTRHEAEGYPRRVDYDLSPAGRRLALLIDALGDWFEATVPRRPSPATSAEQPGSSGAGRSLA